MHRFVAALLVLTYGVNAPAATDPRGDANPPAADIVSLEASGKGGQLRVEVVTAAAYDFAGAQVLIDTDLDGKTGFTVGPLGADLLIEGGSVFTFAGDDTMAWSWTPNATATRGVNGSTLTLSIPQDAVRSDRVAVIARTLASDYTALDQAPDGAGMLVMLERVAEQTEATGDTQDAARDITAVSLKQDGGDVVLGVTTAQPFDFATTLIFFDSDNDPATGYQPSADPRVGFDRLLSAGTLSKHSGADRAAWSWTTVGQAKPTASGNTYTARLSASLLGGTSPKVAVWNMSGDWQSIIDRAPDRGLYDLQLDATLIEPAAAEPQMKTAPPKAGRDLPARQRVAESTSFYCYYGSGRVAELSHYDVVVLHSPQMAVGDIAALKELGVVTIGYISVGEDDQKRVGDGTGPAGLASWYFDRDADGQPDRNSIWNSWYANANDPKWRADRVAEAKRLVEVEGYDGIFLDTLDTAQLYPQTQDGMVQLVAELREAIPDSPIILNQGFKLFHRLAPMADGLMLESFTATYDFESKTYMLNYPASLDAHTRNVNKNLQPVLEKHPMPIFVLDYAMEDDREAIQTAADRAASFGYQFASAPIFLDDVYVNDIVGEADPKWLEMQATPELMSVVLAEAANGFPAGTTLMPSSCYAGYTVAPLVDGVEDRSTLHWSRAAWASSEEVEGATWLRIMLPEAARGGKLRITWATDSGVTHVSQDYSVRTRASADAEWQAASPVTASDETTTTHTLPDAAFTDIEIWQPLGGGSASRPTLLWLAQVEYLPG